MFLAYDGIVFDVLLLNGWDQNAVLSDDGADFLYWHHLIDVTAILSPNVVAADLIPPQERGNLNAILKRRRAGVDNRLRGQNQGRQGKGLLPPTPVPRSRTDVDDNGQPLKTPIPVPGTKVSVNAFPDPSNNTTLFFDSTGAVSEQASANVPSFPPVTEIVPGIPYAADLAAKTGPLTEPLGGTWADNSSEVTAAPASLENTSTLYADDPAVQLTGAIGDAATLIPKIIAGAILGEPPPPPPNPVSGPVVGAHAGQPKPARRVRFPANQNLPATDIELRDRLQVPRRKLSVWINSGPQGAPEYILSLPYDGCNVDANTGPKCVDMNMVAVHGNVTGVKRLVFECFEAVPLFLAEKGAARLKGGNKGDRIQPAGGRLLPQQPAGGLELITPPILSNRWTMQQTPDPRTHLNSTIIKGKAVFRMDVLSRMQITADQLRPYIMPPVATGYVRRPAEVTQGSVGNEIQYTIVDDQQMLNNPGGLRWGVHSVVLVDSVFVNNPMDVVSPVYQPERT